MTDKQPEALRWAAILEHQANYDGKTDYKHKAAAELRRLHEVNAELVEALQQIIDLPEDSRIHYKVARKAIAKAQGENNE